MKNHLRSPAAWIVLAVAAHAIVQGWAATQYPFFGTDAGYRVFFAERPVTLLGNRVWLPFLQVHIWLYYLLGLPASGVKLIAVVYANLGYCCLGLYWLRILGSGTGNALLAATASGALIYRSWVLNATDLMQEPVGFGLFALFLYLTARDGPLRWPAIAVACAALITRDTYWFYLLAITLAALRNRPWSPRTWRALAAAWAIPILWVGLCIPALYLIAFRRFPEFPLQWPLMYNPADRKPTLAETMASLGDALIGDRAHYLAGALLVALVVLLVWRRPSRWDFGDRERFAALVLRAAPLALAMVSAVIVAVDPWQVTPGVRRQVWPLVEICLVVAPLLIRASLAGPMLVRGTVTASILAALLFYTTSTPTAYPRPLFNAPVRAELEKLQSLLDRADGGRRVSVCMQAETVWVVMTDLNWPTFQHRQTYLGLTSSVPGHCRFLVIQDQLGAPAPNGFVRRSNVDTGRYRFTVYEQSAP